jgi:hypothetical protein
LKLVVHRHHRHPRAIERLPACKELAQHFRYDSLRDDKDLEISVVNARSDVRFIASSFTGSHISWQTLSVLGGIMPKQENGQVVETAIEARGAERGPTVRNVLIWSLGLVVAAFAVIYFVFFRT